MKALVLSGDGINCERETAAAFEQVGFQSQIVHINELTKNMGSFKNIPLIEDLELKKNIKKHKGIVRILREHAVTQSRRWENTGYIKTTVLNRLIRILYSFGINPHLLAKKYYKN